MAELKKHALLLSLLSFLLMIKFIVLPVLTWQDTVIFENNNIVKRLYKVDQVLVNESDIQQNNNELALKLANAEELFFSVQTGSAFKLLQQQTIEKLLDKYKLQSSNIGWQTESVLQQSDVKRFQVQLSLSGQFVDLVLLMSELESLSPWYQIDEFNVSPKGTTEGMPGYVQNARIKLNLYSNNESNE